MAKIQLPGVRTDGLEWPRDYTTPAPVPVDVTMLNAGEVPWQELEPGLRRKVYRSDRLTMALIEFTKMGPDQPVLHYHPHDQVTYVLEGHIRFFAGSASKELGPGGVYTLPSNVHHGIQVLTPKAVLLDVFTPVREDMA